MASKKIIQGFCNLRSIEVNSSNVCDYFKGKRRNSKPFCKNCVHFRPGESPITESKKCLDDTISEDEV